MGFDQGGLHSSLFWLSRTPPSMPRQDHPNNQGRRHQNGVVTLNRNFGSPSGYGGNRMAVSNLRNVFDYPQTASSAGAGPFMSENVFGNRLGMASSGKSGFLPTTNGDANPTSYTFGSNNNHNVGSTYNTVHPNHPSIQHKNKNNHSRGYDGGEEYEDLDYYERPPLESPPNVPPAALQTAIDCFGGGRKSLTRRNTMSSSPNYHSSSTATTATGGGNGAVAMGREHSPDRQAASPTPPPPPRFPPMISASAFSTRKLSAKDEATMLSKKKLCDESETNMASSKDKRGPSRLICLCISIAVLALIFLVLGGIVAGYFLYIQRQHNTTNSSLSDFLRDSSRLFRQQGGGASDADSDQLQPRKISETAAILKKSRIGNDLHEDMTSFEDFHGISDTPRRANVPSASDYEDQGTTVFAEDLNVEGSRFAPTGLNLKPVASTPSRERGKFEAELESTQTGQLAADDPLIEPKNLLTLQITRRKICVFEVSTSEQEQSRRDFRSGHIPGARMLFYSSLSHNGVPVHPLQFQRYARSLGIDRDCRVVLYDRGQQIWSAYTFWIFKLYGHTKTSLLNGGFEAWHRLSEMSRNASVNAGDKSNTVYRIESGSGPFSDRPGNFRSAWNSELIATFDDMLATFEAHDGGATNANTEIIDAQTVEEFEGKMSHSGDVKSGGGVIFGHIRGAVNIPSERLYDWTNQTWISPAGQAELFRDEKALVDTTQPIIVYDGTSLRAAMVWFGLYRQGYTHASVYFGSWPEWIIRAPDYLKVIPNVA